MTYLTAILIIGLVISWNKLDLANFDAVAFDFDGTLADTLSIHRTARLTSFKKHGYGYIDHSKHEQSLINNSSYSGIIGSILHSAGEIDNSVPFEKLPLIRSMVKTHISIFDEIASNGLDEMPDATDFVKCIAPLFYDRLSIVTSSKERFVKAFVKKYELNEYFTDEYIIGDMTINSEGLNEKPSGDPYLLAMRKLGSKKLLAFEDTICGVTSAKQAGATVVAICFNEQNTQRFLSNRNEYQPDIIVSDYHEAKNILGLGITKTLMASS